MTISTVGPEKNVYAMGEFLPRLSITLEDQFGNLSRAPIRARVLHCYGCEAEKQTFKYVSNTCHMSWCVAECAKRSPLIDWVVVAVQDQGWREDTVG
jgi:hypothetical protein